MAKLQYLFHFFVYLCTYSCAIYLNKKKKSQYIFNLTSVKFSIKISQNRAKMANMQNTAELRILHHAAVCHKCPTK